MSNQNFKVYTKGGDKGMTSLIGGKRVLKHDLQVEAYGTIDELKSYTALVYDYTDDLLSKKNLLIIIEKLFIAESLIACATYEDQLKMPQLYDQDVEFIEKDIDRMTKDLPALNAFILPGGHPLISQIHICRAICRRAERAYLRFSDQNEVIPVVEQYLNRLSDYYFTLARYTAVLLKIDEILWLPNRP
jgi:cob(I)alamin adenosyltransferase